MDNIKMGQVTDAHTIINLIKFKLLLADLWFGTESWINLQS